MTSEWQGPVREELLPLLDRRSERNGDQTVPSEGTSMVILSILLSSIKERSHYPKITYIIYLKPDSMMVFFQVEKVSLNTEFKQFSLCLYSHCLPGQTVRSACFSVSKSLQASDGHPNFEMNGMSGFPPVSWC